MIDHPPVQVLSFDNETKFKTFLLTDTTVFSSTSSALSPKIPAAKIVCPAAESTKVNTTSTAATNAASLLPEDNYGNYSVQGWISYIHLLGLNGCICHFIKWEIQPFNIKSTISTLHHFFPYSMIFIYIYLYAYI